MTIPSRRGAVNWAIVDRSLCEAYHLTPREVDNLTLAEISVLCIDPDKDKGPPGGRDMSEEEIIAHIKRIRSMTPKQRIREARATRG